jgi:protein phosphatase
MIRGNHEDPTINMMYGFREECKRRLKEGEDPTSNIMYGFREECKRRLKEGEGNFLCINSMIRGSISF